MNQKFVHWIIVLLQMKALICIGNGDVGIKTALLLKELHGFKCIFLGMKCVIYIL